MHNFNSDKAIAQKHLILYQFGRKWQKRGPYKPIEKARVKQEIYHLLLDGNNYEKIMKHMRMPERTFYRYLNEIKQEERSILHSTITPEEVGWQLRLLRDGWMEDLQRMLAIANDKDNKNAVAAQHLAGNLRAGIYRTYSDWAPSSVAHLKAQKMPDDVFSSLNNNNNNEPTTITKGGGRGSNSFRILEIKDPKMQLPLGHRRVAITEKEEEKEGSTGRITTAEEEEENIVWYDNNEEDIPEVEVDYEEE